MEYSLSVLKAPHSPKSSRDRFTPKSKQPSPRISKNAALQSPMKYAINLFPISEVEKTRFEQSHRPVSKSPVLHPLPINKSTKQRSIRQRPYRKVDTTNMQVSDDFYHHPLDWSSKDYIAAMIGDELTYIYHKNLQMRQSECPVGDSISLKFNEDGTDLATGSCLGPIHIIDFERDDLKQSIMKPESACFCVDFKQEIVLGAHEGGSVTYSDLRDSMNVIIRDFKAHSSDCRVVKFNGDGSKFASTASDCVRIWDTRNIEVPLVTFTGHSSEVRAVAFSPTSPDRIVTGGGSNDKHLKVWDCDTGEIIFDTNTGSQICNAFWNGATNEIITTEGFSTNSITFWDTSDLKIVGSITGHTNRVLFCALSETMMEGVTLNPSDGMQFWNFYDHVDNLQLR